MITRPRLLLLDEPEAGVDVAGEQTLYQLLDALVVGRRLTALICSHELDVAKLLARSLGQMFVLAPLIGVGCVLAGLVASSWLDFPSGPAIVVVAGLVFLGVWAVTRWRGGYSRMS